MIADDKKGRKGQYRLLHNKVNNDIIQSWITKSIIHMMANLWIAKNCNYLNESVIRFGVQMMTFLENSFIDRQGGL